MIPSTRTLSALLLFLVTCGCGTAVAQSSDLSDPPAPAAVQEAAPPALATELPEQDLQDGESDSPKTDSPKTDSPESGSPESESPEVEPPVPDIGPESEFLDKPNDADGDDETAEDSEKKQRRIRRQGSRYFSKRSDSFLAVFSPVIASITDSVVRITDGEDQLALGMIVDPNGLILTKASELKGDVTCELADGSTWKPSIVGIDVDSDLVLLKIKKKGIAAVEIEKDRVPSVGSWLVTVQQKELPLSIGIMSHAARKFENIASNSAVIGIFPENRLEGDGVRINRVEIDSPAEAAGLLINDVIVAIDKDPILNREQLLGKLSNFEPGDEIILEVKRGEELMEVPITLGRRRVNPMMESGNRQNRMGSTLSKRRSDFPLAIQHDATLNANECGGPIVDSSGKVVGVNIARDGRVSTLALPNQIVAAVIRKLKTGKFTPEVVNKTEIARVEKELAKLDNELGTLPKEKMEADLQFHAGVAVEEELQLQLKEAEERLKQLQERLAEKKKSNRQLSDALAELQSKQNRIERKKEPLKQELRRLATGIQ